MDEQLREFLISGWKAGERYALAAATRAPAGTTGAHLANRAGSSLEFMDHREYQPGDDLRSINWSAFARSDKLTVKLFREEVSPHMDLVIDASRSMALPDSDKAAATVALAAMLATASTNSRFSHCVWMAEQGYRPVEGGDSLPARWSGINFDYVGDPNQSYTRMPPSWRTRGIRILLSDLLWLGDPEATLSRLSQNAATTVVIQVLAKADMNPPERGNVRLADSETGEVMEIFIDATSQKRYLNALARHQENWRRAAGRFAVVLTTIVAEDFLQNWKLDDLISAEVLKVI